ncbi:MAG: hypothetical protein OZ921_21335, partial [Sorangiineae bacterium]|nr:hypothetical protein [Sorangiineae bacterium]
PASDPAPPPAPAGTTVLHIGDSMAGALGIELDKLFKAAGVRGVLKFKTASFIPQWAWGGDLRLALAQSNPDLVLVSLGANELMVPDPSQRAPLIERIVREIGDRPCVWIGAPLWKGAKGELMQVIHDSARPCRFLDTTRLVGDLPRVGDHIHPTMNARIGWAREVYEWLLRERAPHGAKPWQLVPEPADAPPVLLELPRPAGAGE